MLEKCMLFFVSVPSVIDNERYLGVSVHTLALFELSVSIGINDRF